MGSNLNRAIAAWGRKGSRTDQKQLWRYPVVKASAISSSSASIWRGLRQSAIWATPFAMAAARADSPPSSSSHSQVTSSSAQITAEIEASSGAANSKLMRVDHSSRHFAAGRLAENGSACAKKWEHCSHFCVKWHLQLHSTASTDWRESSPSLKNARRHWTL